MLFVYPSAHVAKSAREATLENNPLSANQPEANAAIGAELVAFLHALGALIDAGKAHPELVGFDGVRGLLDGIMVALPESEEQDAAISALMGLLTADEPTEDMGK
jgi:hypothetical protein